MNGISQYKVGVSMGPRKQGCNKFSVTFSLDLQTRNKLVTLWVNCIKKVQFHQGPFEHTQRHNRCYMYGLQHLMTALKKSNWSWKILEIC